MTDRNKKIQQRDRGQRAASLLENELLQEAFEKLEQAIDKEWKNSDFQENEKRHNAYLSHILLERLKTHFEALVRTGKHAETELTRIK